MLIQGFVTLVAMYLHVREITGQMKHRKITGR
jgi:hypothetical protein